jgi:hypothetical protein
MHCSTGFRWKLTHLFPVRPRCERRHRQSTHKLDEDKRDCETPESHPEEFRRARLLGHGDGEVGRERDPAEAARIAIQRMFAESWGVVHSPRPRPDSRVSHDGAAEAENAGCFDGPRTAPSACARVSKNIKAPYNQLGDSCAWMFATTHLASPCTWQKCPWQ